MSLIKKPKSRTEPIKLSATDRAILESHSKVLDGLASYLGGGYEFVLHSLENLDASVIKIINGHLTGRSEGAPITDLALRMLAKLNDAQNGEGISYFGKTRKGEPLKSTTILIRGHQGLPIGVLCINFHLNTPLQDILSNFIPVTEEVSESTSENFGVDVTDTILVALDSARKKVSEAKSVPASNFNKTVISVLNDQGIFKLKGAVVLVADELGVSKNTVYLHLRSCQESEV